jgi:hypothetical protein
MMDVAIPAGRKVKEKRAKKSNNIQEFTYRDATNVEHEMYGYTGNNWRYRNGNRLYKEMKSIPETLNGFITKTDILGKSHIIRKVVQSES